MCNQRLDLENLYLGLDPIYSQTCHQWSSKITEILFVCFGFLASSSTTRLYRGRAPRQSGWRFYRLPHMRQSWETMTSVSAGHIILTPIQRVGGGWPQPELNPEPPHQESLYRLSNLPPPPPPPITEKIDCNHLLLAVRSPASCSQITEKIDRKKQVVINGNSDPQIF